MNIYESLHESGQDVKYMVRESLEREVLKLRKEIAEMRTTPTPPILPSIDDVVDLACTVRDLRSLTIGEISMALVDYAFPAEVSDKVRELIVTREDKKIGRVR